MIRSEGTGCGDDRRTALVLVVELLPVLCGLTLVLDLGGHGRGPGAAHRCDLRGLRTGGDSTAASVIGDAVVVVDDDGAVVDVGDARDVDTVYGAVVVEVVSVPIAAVITRAGVAEAVINTAVVTDVWSPVAVVETVAVAVEAPVGGGPERSGIGGEDPGSGNPVIAHGGVAPVAGRPEVVGRGGFGLLIGGEWGRRIVGLKRLLAGVDLVLVILVVGVVLIGGLRLLWVGGCSGLGAGLSVLFGSLLALVLLTSGQNAGWSRLLYRRGCGLLATIDRSHVGIGGIGAGVIGCDVRACRIVAPCQGCDSG